MKSKPGKMVSEVLKSISKKTATVMYPAEKLDMPDKYRGKLKFYPEKCVGCKLCVRDCPANAIVITKVAEKKFKADIFNGRCIYCGQCVEVCPKHALENTEDIELAQLKPEGLNSTYAPEIETTATTPAENTSEKKAE